MEPNKKEIAAKIARLVGELDVVAKRGTNDFHKYRYATEADILAAVRGKLSEAGLALEVAVAQPPVLQGNLLLVGLEIALRDSASGETWGGLWYGAGSDTGDKGLYKAYTGALKYFLLKTFLIQTGDDPEADSETDSAAAAKDGASEAGHTTPPARPSASAPGLLPCPECGGQTSESKYRAGEFYCRRRKECGWQGPLDTLPF